MSKLLPPNATKLEKNIEQLGEQTSNLPVPFVDLHRIDRCPVAHLPWLAWQHRVEYWLPEWSEQEKRNAIQQSQTFNAQRGTRSSITSLLRTVIDNFQLKAWYEFQPPQKPFTFVVIINKQYVLSIEQLLQVHTAIDATKSARDNYSVSAKIKTDGEFYITGTITTGTSIYLSSYTDLDYYWQLETSVKINQGIATYTAISSDGFDDYSSFAELNLTEAIVRSLHDSNMQQWQAVIDACNELTGVTDWGLDPANNAVTFRKKVDPNSVPAYEQYCWTSDGHDCRTQESAVRYVLSYTLPGWVMHSYSCPEGVETICTADVESYGYGRYRDYGVRLYRVVNPAYDPDYKDEIETLSLETVAQKIISNASSSNQGISLLAEAYLENVAKSIFTADESKQFVKMANLIENFEQNKIIIN
jgi:phage tail P2-like protein